MQVVGWLAICAVIGLACFIVGAGSFQPMIKMFAGLELARAEVGAGMVRTLEEVEREGAEPASFDLPSCRQVWDSGYSVEKGRNCW